jgi:hypothetical protein
MSLRNYKNFAVVTLGAGITAGQTSNVDLGSGGAAKAPSAPCVGIIWNSTDYATPDLDPSAEVLLFTSITSDTVNAFTRAQEGTSDVAHNTGGKTYKILFTLTAGAVSDLERTIVSGVGTRGISPTTRTAFIPSSPIVLPANLLAVGDLLRMRFFMVRRGTQFTQSWFNYPTIGGVELLNGFGTANSTVGYWIDVDVSCVASGVQAYSTRMHFGASVSGTNGLMTLNLGSTLNVTMDAHFGASATDTLGLEHYRITVQKGVLL